VIDIWLQARVLPIKSRAGLALGRPPDHLVGDQMIMTLPFCGTRQQQERHRWRCSA
jgi:hypothetical protein